MLYGFVNGKIIGRVNIRHELNDFLRTHGGHIGYSVAQKYRGNGYGTKLMAAGLECCKSLGLHQILITCASSNLASVKIIKKFKPTLESEVFDNQIHKEMSCRYWIQL